MYRRFHARLDPSDMVTSFRWLRQLRNTKAVTDVGGLIPAVEGWENQHRRYAARHDCTALTERQKMVPLLGLVPAELQSHIKLNLPRLNPYERSLPLRRTVGPLRLTTRVLCPCKLTTQKGKGKDKGKGTKETRKCHRCGQVGWPLDQGLLVQGGEERRVRW